MLTKSDLHKSRTSFCFVERIPDFIIAKEASKKAGNPMFTMYSSTRTMGINLSQLPWW